MRLINAGWIVFVGFVAIGCSGGSKSAPVPDHPGGGDEQPLEAGDAAPMGETPAADAAPPPEPQSGCIRDMGGCEKRPAPGATVIGACDGAPKAMTLAELSKKSKKLKNKKVSVRGPLNALTGGCTEMACDRECCNTCSGALVLGAPDPNYKGSFLLREAAKAESGASDKYDCSGDESTVCCMHDASGQEVIVTGTLTNMSGIVPADKRLYVIAGATICQPGQ